MVAVDYSNTEAHLIFGTSFMRKKIIIVLQAFCALLACLLAWTAYVANKGYFYFPPATPLCDGEIGAVAINNGVAETFSVGSDSRMFSLWCENPVTLTNTAPHRYVYISRGQEFFPCDFDPKPFWLVWRDIDALDQPNKPWSNGRQIAFPCIWPFHFLAIRKFMTDLAEPTVIRSAGISEFGIYSPGTNLVVEQKNGVKTYRGAIWPPIFVTCTTNIPVVSGVMFGVRFRIEGSFHGRSVPVVKRWVHPPLLNLRTGKLQTEDEVEETAWTHGKSFRWLNDEKVLVPGTWTFQLWHQGAKLCEQSFRLVAVDNRNGITADEHTFDTTASTPEKPAIQP